MSQTTDAKVKIFFKLLAEDFKFEDCAKISSAKIQRLLENPATGTFLSEFIQSVSQENILTPAQLEEYDKIKTQGRAKSGDELQRAIDRHRELNEIYDAQNKELEIKIRNSRLKKKRLEYELMQMNEMKKEQQKRLDGTQNILKDSAHKLRDAKNETASTSEQVSKTINNLAATYESLCNIVQEGNGKSYLLSQVDLQDLLTAEEKYNFQMTSFVKKQFYEISQTIAEDLNGDDDSHKLKSLNDENLFASENEDVKQNIAEAIKRAKLGYPDREKKLISAQAQESAAKSALSFLYQKQTEIQQNQYIANSEDLRKALDDTVKMNTGIKEEMRKLSQEEIPYLISKGTPLQTTHLLTGDYRRKWIRQQYFIEKQQKVILLLQQQQTRLDLLWKLLAVEEAGHKETGKQIDIVLGELQCMLQESVAESEWFEKNQQEKQDCTVKNVFDGNDTLAVSTLKMLGVEESTSADLDSTLYHSFESLSHTAENLWSRLNDARKITMSSSGTHPDEVVLNDLSEAMSKCKSLLTTSDCAKDRGDQEPVILTPKAVSEMTNHLQSEFENLSGIVTKCSKEIDQKKNYLQYNKKAAKMRTMWIDFYLNPNKLPKLDEASS